MSRDEFAIFKLKTQPISFFRKVTATSHDKPHMGRVVRDLAACSFRVGTHVTNHRFFPNPSSPETATADERKGKNRKTFFLSVLSLSDL